MKQTKNLLIFFLIFLMFISTIYSLTLSLNDKTNNSRSKQSKLNDSNNKIKVENKLITNDSNAQANNLSNSKTAIKDKRLVSSIMTNNKIEDKKNNLEIKNYSVKDIATNNSSTWICDSEGNILQYKTQLKLILNNEFKEECLRIEVDKNSMPWVVTKKGEVYRLKNIDNISALWLKVYPNSNNISKNTNSNSVTKPIDVACPKYDIELKENCFIIFNTQTPPYYYNGHEVVESKYIVDSVIKKLAVGKNNSNNERIVIAINDKNEVVELKTDGKPYILGILADDVGFNKDSDLFAINSLGIYKKETDSKFFNMISEVLALNISVYDDEKIWLKGYDEKVYLIDNSK